MIKHIYIFSGIIIGLLVMAIYFSLVVNKHPNEVIGDDYHGFVKYEDVEEKINDEILKSMILEFEENAFSFIDNEIIERVACHKNIIGIYSEFKRYYQVKLRERHWTFDTTFTHKSIYESFDFKIKDEPWINDGGTSQFKVSYDFTKHKVTSFSINGPRCFYRYSTET